ncbi:glycoside hydrolase family 68 protein [uncultured Sphingomonas sp.]|uniref:glycoside hydrolase family 68 protein n=1 Tax=uncultured Sphingomonas sp. TaxID=158754 RepID=UPI0025D23E5B|nr:glycoside hydrolase family 68 protein [uncultured Sphingomonas sp.]
MTEVVKTFRWTPDHVAAIGDGAGAAAPLIATVPPPVLPGIDIWDHWPIIDRAGRTVSFPGGPLIVALTAPILPDPDDRHAIARLRLLQAGPEGWRDFGHLLPDGFDPGSREWAGTTVLERDGRTLSLFYTSAGIRGEAKATFLQRLLLTRGKLAIVGGEARALDWSLPEEIVVPDDILYQSDMTGGGAVGAIKAFRDPFPFVDTDTDVEHVLFTASRAGSDSAWNGQIGIARREGDGWTLLPPLVDADGVNNELERPHIVRHDGRLLMFWSTQAKVFADGGPRGPTGLYGVIADSLYGLWRPLNGTGLVLANPPEAPFQAYSWLVLDDLSVWSFADLVGLQAPPADTAEARRAFAGTPAPVVSLAVEGDTTRVVG